MTCMKQEFCIHEKYCQRHIGQNFDSCILFSRNSKPMTNEEWFNTLSTEEKAKWLSKISKFFHECGKRDVYPKTMYEEDWECWLKEIHHDGNA